MCGIAGKILFGSGKVSPQEIKKMTDIIARRGPDDEGVFVSKDGLVGLGNRRLAVIDLSPNGHQPMTYLNRYTITFNGEIYNFREEKQKLEKASYKFFSNSDTEVILALYDKYRNKCLDYLKGMFAFAIYDNHEKTVFIARDRIGVKPLKYFLDGDTFIFASELKAILTQKQIKKTIDYKAIQMYLTYGYVPSPLTGFVGIKKLEPGHYISISLKNKSFNKKRYWQPMFKHKSYFSEKEWSNKILSTLERATKRRMISDVPIGAFLSGGVDSSGVVACMARLSDKPIKTFTVKFSDKNFSEEKYAGNIAKMYKTDHSEILAKPASIEILPEIAYQFEEPFADAGSMVTWIVSKLARKYVTVILNGDGADEEFLGYPNRYLRLQRDVDYYSWINFLRPAALESLKVFGKITKSTKAEKARKFLEKSRLPLYRRFASYNQYFDLDQIHLLSKGALAQYDYSESIYEPVMNCFNLFNGKDLKDAGTKFDLLYYLSDDLLTKADIASMAASLEARSPFLDREMIELSCKMPFSLKIKGGETKYILKKALEKIVPKENLYRPKMGFGVPLADWFRGSLNKYAESLLLSPKSFVRKIMDIDQIKIMLEVDKEGEDFGPRIWALMSLELWYQSYFQ